MTPTLIIQLDETEREAYQAFLDGIKGHLTGATAREQLLPILKSHLQPLVESEKAYLEPHDKSGALSASLSVRAGSGDDPGTVSVFSAPTASTSLLDQTWGLRGRSQQKKWAANLTGTTGRKRVFYGPIVHQGHRIVVRGKGGTLVDTGKVTQAVPFAEQAAEAMGDEQAEACAVDIMDLVLGK